jgi:hypothetical protein
MKRQVPVIVRSKSPTIWLKSCWNRGVSADDPETNAAMTHQIRPLRFRSTPLRHILGLCLALTGRNVCAVPPRKGFGHAAI